MRLTNLTALCVAGLVALAGTLSAADHLRLHLLFTNDIHGALHATQADFMNPEFGPAMTGGAGAYTYVNDVRRTAAKTGDAVLLLDGGNIFQGTPLGTNDGGATIIKWMNLMGYDALTPGLDDFDQGVDNLRRLASLADFPLLSANIKTAAGDTPDWLRPYFIRTIAGVKVAVVGLSSHTIPQQTFPANTTGLEFRDDVATARELVDRVRAEGATVVILLAHTGLPYDREMVFEELLVQVAQEGEEDEEGRITEHDAMALAHLVPGIDVIVTGGVSKGYDDPWEDPLTHTLVVQNYGNLTGLGHLELLIDRATGMVTGYDYPVGRGMLVSLLQDDVWPDPAIADSIRRWVTASGTLERPDYTAAIAAIKSDFIPQPVDPALNQFAVPNLGAPERLEVVTWNLEWFPAAGDTTLRSVAEIINDWGVDLVAFQEIKDVGQFARLMELLPNHGYVISQQSSFLDQAIVFRKDFVTLLGSREPFAYNDYYFAGRPPLMADFYWSDGTTSREFSLVDVHLKCCGDGLYRRQISMEQLHDLLASYLSAGFENIIVAGDWNDQLDDTGLEQSFYPFLNDRNNFRYATEAICRDPEQASYPTWPSFLDHILYAKGFFDEQAAGGQIRTLKPDEYVGGWNTYETTISDHRPVLWSIPIE